MKSATLLSALVLSAAAAPLTLPRFAIFGSGDKDIHVPHYEAELRSELAEIHHEREQEALQKPKPYFKNPKALVHLEDNTRSEAAEMIHRISVERCGKLGC